MHFTVERNQQLKTNSCGSLKSLCIEQNVGK